MNKFEIGDKVHCSFNDKDGVVTHNAVELCPTYPLQVKFKDKEDDLYTIDGKWSINDEEPCLTKIS